jgi:hypothetical protein
MATNFYFKVMGEVFGPMTGHELRENALAGEVTPDTLVRLGDDGDWVLAAKLSNLFDENWRPLPHPDDPQTQRIAHAQWFLEQDGQVVGPLEKEQLIDSANEGRFRSTNRVKCGETGEWHFAGDLPWLEEFTGKPPALATDDAEPGQTNELLDKLEWKYRNALRRIDTSAKELVGQSRDMQALDLVSTGIASIEAVRDDLSQLYSKVKQGSSVLKHLDSQRLKKLKLELIETSASIFEYEEDRPRREAEILQELRKLGFQQNHWCVSDLVVTEIEYMLAVLKVLMEPDYAPPLEDSFGDHDMTSDQ